jgi:hypothetical integral membrane protein (TIGR02206 family)
VTVCTATAYPTCHTPNAYIVRVDFVGRSFQPFGAWHWAMLILTAIGAVVLIPLGRRLRGRPAEVILCRVFAVVLLTVSVVNFIHDLLPGNFVLSQSLPLQLSDLLRFVAGYALWSRRPWAVSLTYYWGLTLNLQSLVTPNLHYRYSPLYDFSMYWGLHIGVMWAAFLLTWGVGLRPNWRSYWTAVVVTVSWAAIAFTFNLLAGTNYGFLNRKPSTASLFDLMGGWPTYLLVSFVAMMVIWALITLPWTITARQREMRASPG